jgi:hypothetical protein
MSSLSDNHSNSFQVAIRVARYPGVFAIDSHKPTSAVLIIGAIVSVASRPASIEEMQWVCGSFHL